MIWKEKYYKAAQNSASVHGVKGEKIVCTLQQSAKGEQRKTFCGCEAEKAADWSCAGTEQLLHRRQGSGNDCCTADANADAVNLYVE